MAANEILVPGCIPLVDACVVLLMLLVMVCVLVSTHRTVDILLVIVDMVVLMAANEGADHRTAGRDVLIRALGSLPT